MGLTKPRAAQIFNLDYKQATRVVTTTNITLAGGAPSSVDGVSLTTGDRVLVTGQTTGSQNGLYKVSTLGSGANGTWVRTSDGNDTGEIEAGMIVMVTEGVIYADTQWKLITDDPITIGTTSLSFTQNYSANSIAGGTSNVRVFSNANVTVSSAGTANVLTVSSTGTVITGTESVTGNITGGNILTGGLISATGNATVGNITATIATLTTFTSAQGGNVTGTLVATSSNAQFFNQTNGAGYVTVAGYLSATGNVTGGNLLTGGLISATGNITGNYFLGNVACASGIYASRIFNGTSEANIGTSGGNANISIGGVSNVIVFATTGEYVTGLLSVTGNITGGNVSATNHTGTNVSITGTVTAASTVGGVITGSSSSVTGTQTAASTVGGVITGSSASVTGTVTAASTVGGVITGSSASVSGTVTAASTVGGVITGSSVSASGNITSGNVLTSGQLSATGTITSNGATNSTAFAVGNSAVSNVGLGFFPTAGTPGEYAIRDYSTVPNSIYFDVGMGGTANGTFQFRTSNSFRTLANINSSGINTPYGVSATGNILSAGNIIASKIVSATDNMVINSTGAEGGQLVMAWPGINNITGQANQTWNLDTDAGNTFRLFYQNGAGAAGVLLQASPTSNIVSFPQSAGISATGNVTGSYFIGNGSQLTGVTATTTSIVNGTSNVVVAASGNVTVGVAGTSGVATFYTGGIIANSIAATNNGAGTNFKVGDDAWIGDINLADTMSIRGQQSALNGYIVFGNADGTQLGRAGSGPLTYGGAFSASGNITGGNVLTAGLISATGNATGGNINTGGLISAAGNIIGNRIAVAAGTAGAPSVQFSNDTAADTGFYWISDGNIGVTTNGTLRATFLDTGLSVTANITGGNLLTGGLISATGNITGGNISATNHTGTTVSVTGNVNGANIVAATSLTNGNISITGANIVSVGPTLTIDPNGSGGIDGNVIIAGNLSVTGNVTYINSNNVTTNDLTINMANNAATAAAANGGGIGVGPAGSEYISLTYNSTSNIWVATNGLSSQGILSATGNITGGNISATNHTGTNVSVTGTVTAASTVGGVITGSSASVSGTVTAASTVGGVITGSSASVTGTITAASTVGGVITGSSASASGNVTGGNINTAGNISATGNIAGNYLLANIYYATGFSASRIFNGTSEANIGTAGGNANISVGGVSNVFVVSSTGIYTTGLSSVTGNITGGNVSTGGLISATGNINTAGTVNINSTAGNYNVLNISGTALAPYGTPQTWKFFTNNTALGGNPSFILFPDSSTQTTAYPGTSSTLSLTGNVTGGNILTGGLISATGTVTGSSLIGSVVTATGNITGGNVLTGGLISATGNVTGGNILTVGQISATGNVTGNYHIGNGSQLTGISAFSNVAVANGNAIVANSISSTLTLSAGSGITLVATPGTGVITIATSSGGTSIFATGGDMGTVTETVTASEDLGLVTDAVTTSYDLGSVVSASGLVYPSQLILPAYTPGTLPSAAPAAQFVYLSTSSIGAMTAFSDGTNWRFTSSGNIVS